MPSFSTKEMSIQVTFQEVTGGQLSTIINLTLGTAPDALILTFGDPGGTSINAGVGIPTNVYLRLDQFAPVYAALNEVLSRKKPDVVVSYTSGAKSANVAISGIALPLPA